MISIEKVSAPLYNSLEDKVCMLMSSRPSINEVTLFEEACAAFYINITSFYKEDILHLGSYICQIIFNDTIYITAASGSTHELAYRNAACRFVNLCFAKRHLIKRFPESNPDLFYDEINMSIESILLTDDLKNKILQILNDLSKNGYSSMLNLTKYESIKDKLKDMGMNLSETYNVIKGDIICSIFVNDVLLIQQNSGSNQKGALENTILSFFTSYEIISTENVVDSSKFIYLSSKKEILRQLSQLFLKMKNDLNEFKNYWDIVLECANKLNFNIIVKSGEIKINNVLIVDINEANEYIGNIKAGKELVKLLNEGEMKVLPTISQAHSPITSTGEMKVLPTISQAHSPITSTILNFSKTTKVYNKIELDEQLIKISQSTNLEYIKDKKMCLWNLLNLECHKESFKIVPSYKDTFKEVRCTFLFQGWIIASGIGIHRNSAREAASRNLIETYLSPKSD